MNHEDLYTISPSTHAVPHSPFLLKMCHSPAPCVPDVDRINRRLRYGGSQLDKRPSHVAQSPLVSLQTDSQSQRLPMTPSINVLKTGEPVQRKINTDTPSIEQVVPSCSPFIMQDEMSANSQQRDFSQYECSKNIAVISDEKPPTLSSKRQNRNLTVNKSPELKEINFFDDNDIFG